jgi:hypothetical protein
MKISHKFLDGVVATGEGKGFNVEEFGKIVIGVFGTAGTNATVKVKGSIQEVVDFNAVVSNTNKWDYAQVITAEDGSVVDGDTGIVAGAGYTMYELNVEGLVKVSADLHAYTAGAVSVDGVGINNNL